MKKCFAIIFLIYLSIIFKPKTIEKSYFFFFSKVFFLYNFFFLFFRKGRIYLVFEYVEKNLLEVLEEKPDGLEVAY